MEPPIAEVLLRALPASKTRSKIAFSLWPEKEFRPYVEPYIDIDWVVVPEDVSTMETTLNKSCVLKHRVKSLVSEGFFNLLGCNPTLPDNAGTLKNLEVLRRFKFPNNRDAICNLSNLRILDIDFCPDVSSLTRLTKLQSITINGTSADDWEDLKKLPNLESLSVPNPKHSIEINAFAALTNLTKLTLGEVKGDNVLASLASLTRLSSLDVDALYHEEILDLRHLKSMTGLADLALSGDIVNLAQISHLADILRNLSLCAKHDIDARDLKDITALKKLNLDGPVRNMNALSALTLLEEATIVNDIPVCSLEAFFNMLNLRHLKIEDIADTDTRPMIAFQVQSFKSRKATLEYVNYEHDLHVRMMCRV